MRGYWFLQVAQVYDANLFCRIYRDFARYNDSVVPDCQLVTGTLRKGYGVASGPSADYPYGSLERQFPIFRSRGLDLSSCFPGTLNIDIRPLAFELIKPEFTFRDVNWTDLHPPETFSFSACSVTFANTRTEGWIYFPHPETKERNFHDPSLLEVIAPRIPDLKIGDQLLLLVNPARVLLKRLGDAVGAA